MLNLGSLECDRGHAEAALAAADAAGELGLSTYGRAVRAVIRHCVAHQLGDQDAAASQLEVLAELTDDAPLLYLDALLLSGQADNALALVRNLLASDDRRSLALGWAQDCRRPEPLPAQVEERVLREAFLAREDVLGAISAVGRIESHDVYCRPNG